MNDIRLNMLGYVPGLPVDVVLLSGDGLEVLDESGKLVKRMDDYTLAFDKASEDNVALVNLGELPEGKYILKSGLSERTITVKRDAYRDVTNALIKGLYYQRCGCGLDKKHAGIYAHEACHTAPATDWEDRSIVKSVPGGWHDAGDYGKYVGPGAVTVAHMLYAYLLFPSGCSDDLNIPESGNGTPDILNEARFELEWILKMQKDDGSFYHKLTTERFAPFVMPEEDKEPEYLIPASHCATAAAVAVLALASRIYKKFDRDFSDKALSSALKGWEWLEKNPDFKPYIQPEGINTGTYGDWSDRDERFWAGCELFASTGEEKYRKAAEDIYKEVKDPVAQEERFRPFLERMKRYNPNFKVPIGLDVTQYGWMDVSGLGAICCLFVLKESAGSVLFNELRSDFLKKSSEILELAKASGYGTAVAHDKYIWGSILTVMGNAMTMIIDWLLTQNTEMRDYALIQLDYALGLNALDLSFVTGFGERRVMNPHHRPSGADGIDEPVPGLISGGPNKGMNFPGTKEALKDAPPAKYFLDETPSADTNEIAIYWNSPAIFVAACFNSIK